MGHVSSMKTTISPCSCAWPVSSQSWYLSSSSWPADLRVKSLILKMLVKRILRTTIFRFMWTIRLKMILTKIVLQELEFNSWYFISQWHLLNLYILSLLFINMNIMNSFKVVLRKASWIALHKNFCAPTFKFNSCPSSKLLHLSVSINTISKSASKVQTTDIPDTWTQVSFYAVQNLCRRVGKIFLLYLQIILSNDFSMYYRKRNW